MTWECRPNSPSHLLGPFEESPKIKGAWCVVQGADCSLCHLRLRGLDIRESPS